MRIKITHPACLLILAACFHLAATTSVFTIGRLSLMPAQFDRNGIGEFVSHDAHLHHNDAMELTETFRSQGATRWLTAANPLHVRIYSFSQLLFSRWIGFNILSLEPINLAFYLAILAMVYKLTEAMFDRRAALLAATVVALWPSLVLHTTQPLRDPLLITLVMAFFLVLRYWIADVYSWRPAIIAGLCGALILLLIWIVRVAMWDITRVIIGLGFVLFVLRQVRERRLLPSNVITGAVLIAALFTIPYCNRLLQFTEKKEADSGRPFAGFRAVDLSLWQMVAARRNVFIQARGYEDYEAGSDIDSDVKFRNKTDLIRYLPRAATIGLFAPFPNIWFARGLLVGRSGRLLAGAEMLATYLIEALALIGVWQQRRRFSVWLSASSAILGTTALGFIVINMGSLYRYRYPYWILLVVLGAGGAVHLVSRWSGRQPR